MAIGVERRLEVPGSVPRMVAITMPPSGQERVDWFKRFLDVLTALILGIGLYFAWDQAEKLTQSINSNNNSINISSVAALGNQGMEIDKIFHACPVDTQEHQIW
jgi:hypothetical protein